jgi:hypothetical protein
VSLTPAARAKLARTLELEPGSPPPTFSRIVDGYANSGDYIWLGLKAWTMDNGSSGEPCENRFGMYCTEQWGGIIQFNTRSKTMRYLLPPLAGYNSPDAMVVAGGHLWLGKYDEVIRFRIIPGTGVRRASIDTTYPRGTIRSLESDGRLVALVSDNGVAIADAATATWRARWFGFDDTADTTLYWLTTRPAPPDSAPTDTTEAGSYGARRGVRVLMDALGLPTTERPAFRAAAARLPASRYIDFFDVYDRGSSNVDPEAFLRGAYTEAVAALADSVFLPFLVRALGAKAPPGVDWRGGWYDGFALSALLAMPGDAGRRSARAVLDTVHDVQRAVGMALHMTNEHDEDGRRWLVTRFTDPVFLAHEVLTPSPESADFFSAISGLRDTTLAPILFDLLADPRMRAWAYDDLRMLGSVAPRIWSDLARRGVADSSLAGALLQDAANDTSIASDPGVRPFLHGAARRVLQLVADTSARKRFSTQLGGRPDENLVSSAARLVAFYRGADAIPDLVRVLREGNVVDQYGAAAALVNLTGVDSAPAWTGGLNVGRHARFWTNWLARAPRPIVAVSAVAGAAAAERWRMKPRSK